MLSRARGRSEGGGRRAFGHEMSWTSHGCMSGVGGLWPQSSAAGRRDDREKAPSRARVSYVLKKILNHGMPVQSRLDRGARGASQGGWVASECMAAPFGCRGNAPKPSIVDRRRLFRELATHLRLASGCDQVRSSQGMDQQRVRAPLSSSARGRGSAHRGRRRPRAGRGAPTRRHGRRGRRPARQGSGNGHGP